MTKICSFYGINYSANAKLIKGLNNSKNLNTIYVGDTVYLPVPTSAGGSIGGTGSGVNPSQSGYSINLIYSSSEGVPYAAIEDRIVVRADEGKTHFLALKLCVRIITRISQPAATVLKCRLAM